MRDFVIYITMYYLCEIITNSPIRLFLQSYKHLFCKNQFLYLKKKSNKIQKIKQRNWLNENDEYKFRFSVSDDIQFLLEKINAGAVQTLKEQFPKKSLRTCAMLLDRGDKFIRTKMKNQEKCNTYRYYQGSKSLYDKYCIPRYNKYYLL